MSRTLIQILQNDTLSECYEALSRYDQYKLNNKEIVEVQNMLEILIVKTNTFCRNMTLSQKIIMGQMKKNWDIFLATLEQKGDHKTLKIAKDVGKRCKILKAETNDTFNTVLKTALLSDCYECLSAFDRYNLSTKDLEEFRKFLPSLFLNTENYISTLKGVSHSKEALNVRTMKKDFQKFISVLKNMKDEETLKATKDLKKLWETVNSLLKANSEKSRQQPVHITQVSAKNFEKQQKEGLKMEKFVTTVIKEKEVEKKYNEPEKFIFQFPDVHLGPSITALKLIDDAASAFKLEKSYTVHKIIEDLNIDAVGIDLGTTRCRAAVNRRNGIQTVALDSSGERLLPSYVSFDESHAKCGKVVVGRMRNYAKSTVFDTKRIIGRTIDEIQINENWPFKIINDKEEGLFLEILGFNDETARIKPVDVVAILLKHIKQKAEEFQGRHLGDVVITVPAIFTETQKKETLEAAKIAGWKKVVLLPEPIAALFAYLFDRKLSDNSLVLLFDLGGGTLSICIFRIFSNQIQIILNSGDFNLGGNDFDKILTNYVKNLLITEHNVTLKKDKTYKLMSECQIIKETLSIMSSCQ